MIVSDHSTHPGKKNTDGHIAIIGAGITGLFIGYFLTEKGYRISIFEKEKYAGGALATFVTERESRIEKFYHHILSFNHELLSFLKNTGYAEALIQKSCPVGLISKNKTQPMNSYGLVSMLKELNLIQVIRSFRLIFDIILFRKWNKWDKMTAEELITSYFGGDIWKRLYYPMILSKFGKSHPHISALWLVNKMRQKIRIRKHRSGEQLIYMKGSFQVLIDHLVDHIRGAGGAVHLGLPVDKIFSDDQSVTGLQAGEIQLDVNTIISTIAQPEFVRIEKADVEPAETLVPEIPYTHSLCTVIRLKRKLSDFYWLYNLDEAIPFAAIIEHTRLTGTALYEGETILYIARYLDSKKELYASSDEAVMNEYLPHLERIFPDFDREDVIQSYVFRQANAQPVFMKGYLKRIPPQSSGLNGLYSVNMSQLFPQGRTLENCFLLAREFSDKFNGMNPEKE